MDSHQKAPERLSRLRRWWRLLTVPAERRCSFCLRRAVVWETLTEEHGSLRVVKVTRYCGECHEAKVSDGGADG